MHYRYGRSEMAEALLLSRRSIEAGVRFVTANAVSIPENTRLSPFQILGHPLRPSACTTTT